jgi:hypothetical protein
MKIEVERSGRLDESGDAGPDLATRTGEFLPLPVACEVS